MSKERMIKRYRAESYILNPGAGEIGSMNFAVTPGDRQNLLNNITLLAGDDKGYHFYGLTKKTAAIPALEDQLAKLKEKFKNYKQHQLNLGHKLPEKPNPELQAKFDSVEAHLVVRKEELAHIQKMLSEVDEVAEKEREHREPCLGPQTGWNRESLKDGILCTVAGQTVSPNKDGVLEISDSRSPYKGIEIWRWRSEIVKPMNREYNYRIRQMHKKKLEDREKVPFPAAPQYDPKSNKISYPGYNPGPLRKLGLL